MAGWEIPKNLWDFQWKMIYLLYKMKFHGGFTWFTCGFSIGHGWLLEGILILTGTPWIIEIWSSTGYSTMIQNFGIRWLNSWPVLVVDPPFTMEKLEEKLKTGVPKTVFTDRTMDFLWPMPNWFHHRSFIFCWLLRVIISRCLWRWERLLPL